MCRLYDVAYVLEKRHNIKLFRQRKKKQSTEQSRTAVPTVCGGRGIRNGTKTKQKDPQNNRGIQKEERQTDGQTDN